MSFNEIFERLSLLKLAVYAPISYILPSRLKKYEEMYDTQVAGKASLNKSTAKRACRH